MVRNVYVTLAFALLASCGGGSGGGSAPVTLPTPAPTPSPTPSETPTPAPNGTTTPANGAYLTFDQMVGDQSYGATCSNSFISSYISKTGSNIKVSAFNYPVSNPKDVELPQFQANEMISSSGERVIFERKYQGNFYKIDIYRPALYIDYVRNLNYNSIVKNVSNPLDPAKEYFTETFCSFGVKTKISDLPNIGFVNYGSFSVSGTLHYRIQDATGTDYVYEISRSEVDFSINFENDEIFATFRLGGKKSDGNTISLGPFKASGKLNRENNTFEIEENPNPNVESLKVSGALYGPSAAEIGVIFEYYHYDRQFARHDILFDAVVTGQR